MKAVSIELLSTISPNGGTFTSSTQVALLCSTSEATIRYTTDGATPSSNSTQFTGAFTVSSSCIVKARGFKIDYTESDEASANFTITTEEIPELSVIPDYQTVTDIAGTTTFSVDNTGAGDMPWTASVVSGEDWLSITSGSSGANSGTINVKFQLTFEFVFSNKTIQCSLKQMEVPKVCIISVHPSAKINFFVQADHHRVVIVNVFIGPPENLFMRGVIMALILE